MRSCWRCYAYDMWGGLEWLSILIALGDVPAECVQMANMHLLGRIDNDGKRQPSSVPVVGARLSRRQAAIRDGQEVPEVQGPSCKDSEAKVARDEAKRLDRTIKSAMESSGGQRPRVQLFSQG